MTVDIPMRLQSIANMRLHWAAKAKMVKRQRDTVRLAMALHPDLRHWRTDLRLEAERNGALAVITLTRIGPRTLDSDNVASAFKGIRDQVAAELGIDDGDPRLRWDYAQEKGDYGIRIEVKPA